MFEYYISHATLEGVDRSMIDLRHELVAGEEHEIAVQRDDVALTDNLAATVSQALFISTIASSATSLKRRVWSDISCFCLNLASR